MHGGHTFRHAQHQLVPAQVKELGHPEDAGHKVTILAPGPELQTPLWAVDFQGNLCSIGKGKGQRLRAPQAQSGKVWGSQSHFTGGRTEAQKDRKAGRATEPSTLKEGDRSAGHRVASRVGAGDGTEGSPNSQAGTEVGLDGYYSMPPEPWGDGAEASSSPVGTHLHRSLGINTTCSGGCVSSARV